MRLFDKLYICADNSEMVTHINKCHLDSIAFSAVKYKSGRIGFSADSQWMYFNPWFICRKLWWHFEHMAGELYLFARCQIVGVVFGHFFKDCLESRDLIVAFRSKSYSLCHHILSGYSRELV